MTNTINKVIRNGVEYQFNGVNGGVTSVNTRTGDVTGLAEDNAVVKLTGDQTVAGTKTFSTSPVVPSKTSDATNTGTAIATEAQVYKKQDSLSTQTAYTSKGSSTKVPQITTNTLGQVTGITEVTIDQPDISGKADKTEVLTLTNTTSYTPSADYHPATKKYVDDSAASVDGVTTTQPSNPVAGSTYFDTTAGKLKVYDGTQWIEVGSGGGGGIQNDTTGTTTTVSAIRAGTENEYNALATHTEGIIYHVY